MGRRAAMCRAWASRRCRRYVPRTFNHKYPTACMSSGGPSILRGREAGSSGAGLSSAGVGSPRGLTFGAEVLAVSWAARMSRPMRLDTFVREGVPAGRSPVSLGTIQSRRGWARAPRTLNPWGGEAGGPGRSLPGSRSSLSSRCHGAVGPLGPRGPGSALLGPCHRWPWPPWAWR